MPKLTFRVGLVSRRCLNEADRASSPCPFRRQERFVYAFPMRYLFRFEVEHLLARCGFIAESVYADFNRSPYGSTYPGELIFVVRKV